MMQVRNGLGADGERLQTVFVTIDPDRDTPKILKAYVANFGPGVTALRGTPEQKATPQKNSRCPGRSPGTYTKAHTAASFVFDETGKARLYVPFGGGAEPLAADLRQLDVGA